MAAHLLPNPKMTRTKPTTTVTGSGIILNSSMYGCWKFDRVRKLKPIVWICQPKNIHFKINQVAKLFGNYLWINVFFLNIK